MVKKKQTKQTKNPIKRVKVKRVVQQRTIESKARFLITFMEKGNNISESCKAANICRDSFYLWMNKDAVFKKAVADARESLHDFAETALIKAMQDGNFQAIKFYLINKAPDRGWQETTNIVQNVGVQLEIIHHYEKPPKKKNEKTNPRLP